MYDCTMSLPEYHMTAGESKSFFIPIRSSSKNQIDTTDMTARFAVSDYVTPKSWPIISKDCSLIESLDDGSVVLQVVLDPEDTVRIHGKYIYQITTIDKEGTVSVAKGILFIHCNLDPCAAPMTLFAY